MILCAYLVNGTPVNEMTYFTESDLSGNDPYQIANTLPSGYQDISSIENWWYMYEHQNGIFINKDYKYVRNEIIVLAATTGWSNLNSTEKQIAASIFAVGKAERDEIYTLDQQIQLGLLHHKNSIESRTSRLARVQMQMFNRLDKSDWEVVASDVNNLLAHYINEGREGTLEGDSEGLFDYVDGDARVNPSHTWDGTGSEVGFRNKTFTAIGYNNCSLFADDLLDILKNGNY